MENYVKLSTLNDFIFCPKSIYYNKLYENYEDKIFKQEEQLNGKILHESIDNKTYSTRKNILQGLEVYSEKYKIAGKIDIFDMDSGELVERKTQIFKDENGKEKIYKGYKLQLWGQMFCLEEMGYKVKSLAIYSVKDNKKYKIYKPNEKNLEEFEEILKKYREFDIFQKYFRQNLQKCKKCIYRELCDYFIGEVCEQTQIPFKF